MKVLVAEDDLVSLKMLSAALGNWGYEVIPANNGLLAFDLLTQQDGPRLALLDWEMPGMEGIEVCSRLRERTDLPFRYLIVLTGRDRPEDVAAALEQGADDHVTKPWTSAELRARIGVGNRIIRLHEHLEENERRLIKVAQTDDLTQIWNRPAIMRRLDQELARSDRSKLPFALLMLDVDHFKAVNDSYGHLAGDAVLKEIAARIQNACRKYDIVGRYGGEEFLAILHNTSPEGVWSLAQRFRSCIAEQPISAEGISLTVTASVGAVWHNPEFQSSVDLLVGLADKMLYQAKENGRNRVEFAHFGEGPVVNSCSPSK
jgi:two-component system cell cycle response regulator